MPLAPQPPYQQFVSPWGWRGVCCHVRPGP